MVGGGDPPPARAGGVGGEGGGGGAQHLEQAGLCLCLQRGDGHTQVCYVFPLNIPVTGKVRCKGMCSRTEDGSCKNLWKAFL